MLNQLDFLTSKIVAKRAERSAEQAVLVGISGIDAGGKGFITEKIAKRLFIRNCVETRGYAMPGRITARRNDPGFYNNLLSRTAHPFRQGQSAGCR
jgi:hypothetical protein